MGLPELRKLPTDADKLRGGAGQAASPENRLACRDDGWHFSEEDKGLLFRESGQEDREDDQSPVFADFSAGDKPLTSREMIE